MALSQHLHAFVGGYTEVVLNRYDAPRPADFRGGPYRTSLIQAGLAVQGSHQTSFEAMFEARVGNGRGADFALVKRPSINLGFRVRP